MLKESEADIPYNTFKEVMFRSLQNVRWYSGEDKYKSYKKLTKIMEMEPTKKNADS